MQTLAQAQLMAASSAQLTFTKRECCTMFEWPVSGSRSAASKPGLNVRLGPFATYPYEN